jgi:(p)ppGpp synthase/HD superfamily hydrolase
MTTRPDADVDLIRHAYDVAALCHQGQLRKSGDPYITHPLTVANILARLQADDQTLCAAILHGTLEDTPYTHTAISPARHRADRRASAPGLDPGVLASGYDCSRPGSR